MPVDLLGGLGGHQPDIVVIGASAGAVQALTVVLPALPATFPVPVAIVVHLPGDRLSAMPDLFRQLTTLDAREVEDKMPLERGHVYVAAPDYHLLVESGLVAALSADEPVLNCRPSIDVLFESTADAAGSRALGILLSGANADGAAGLAALRERGALTWVQTPSSCEVSVMPEAALARADHLTLTPVEIASALAEWGARRG
jgi:two-component system chemotaxis response regulator CheB